MFIMSKKLHEVVSKSKTADPLTVLGLAVLQTSRDLDVFSKDETDAVADLIQDVPEMQRKLQANDKMPGVLN